MESGRRGAADVHRHRVADVGDARSRGDAGEVDVGVVEDRRVGLGDADDVAVDDAAHRDAGAGADLADAGAPQHGLDLPAGVGHHAERHARPLQRTRAPSTLSGIGHRHRSACGCGRARRAASSTSPSATPIDAHVGAVVLDPVPLLGALGRLDRHRRVVGAAMAVDVGDRLRSTRAAGRAPSGRAARARRRHRARRRRSAHPAAISRRAGGR